MLHQKQFRFIKFTLKQFHTGVVTFLKRMFGFYPTPALRMKKLMKMIYLIEGKGMNEEYLLTDGSDGSFCFNFSFYNFIKHLLESYIKNKKLNLRI